MRKTNRAIILPSVGDPLLLNLWYKCHQKNSRDSVDKIYLKMTNLIDPNARDFIVKSFEADGHRVWYQNTADVHGNVIRDLLEHVEEETVVLLEDDCFVLEKNSLDEMFVSIEDGSLDCIGSTRNCCSVAVVNAIAHTFSLTGQSPEHHLKDCPNLWPCLFFSKISTLRKTDGIYGAKHWQPGEVIPYNNMKCDVLEIGDSFVWASIQLRGQGNRFGYIHQCHTAPCDIHDIKTGRGLFALPNIPWIHVGSLSAGITGLIKYQETDTPLSYGVPDSNAPKLPVPYPPVDDSTRLEYTRRLAMLKFIADHGKLEDSSCDEFNQIYSDGVDRAIREMGLCPNKVAEYYAVMSYMFSSILELS